MTISSATRKKIRMMNEIYYFLEESKFEDEDEIIRDVFGICAKDSEGNTRATYPDLFFERQRAVDFVDMCNEVELEICHLPDVIEDELG